MGHYKISKLLNNSTVSKFVTTKWIEVNHLSRSQNMRFKASTLRSDSCEYSNAYIVAIGTKYRLADDANENEEIQKSVAFKNNAPFRSYISTFQ